MARLICRKSNEPNRPYSILMAAFVFRCPDTGRNVHGFVADDPKRDDDSFEPVPCLICSRTHLVNPQTGKVLGGKNE